MYDALLVLLALERAIQLDFVQLRTQKHTRTRILLIYIYSIAIFIIFHIV